MTMMYWHQTAIKQYLLKYTCIYFILALCKGFINVKFGKYSLVRSKSNFILLS